MKIHIEWDQAISMEEAKTLTGVSDYGIYQIYGTHPVYGSDVLLYIGKARDRTFGERLKEHWEWGYGSDIANLKISVGRLGGNKSVSDEKWGDQIDHAESLLIFSHKPAYNSQNIQSINVPIETHVFNWLNYKSLAPEVSAFRYMAEDNVHFKAYKTFSL